MSHVAIQASWMTGWPSGTCEDGLGNHTPHNNNNRRTLDHASQGRSEMPSAGDRDFEPLQRADAPEPRHLALDESFGGVLKMLAQMRHFRCVDTIGKDILVSAH